MQKLTNKEEEIMQILWKLKSFCKEVMAEITESTTLQHSRLL
jgi:predicted transcriptional regulator